MLQIWFIGKRWNLVFASPPLLEIWARFVIELHSKWSCHLITLWPRIFKGFKWSQIPTLHSSTVSSETQLLFQRPWAACKARSVIDTREQIYCGTPILMLYLTFQVGCCSQTSCSISSNIPSEYTERVLWGSLLERLSISPEDTFCL